MRDPLTSSGVLSLEVASVVSMTSIDSGSSWMMFDEVLLDVCRRCLLFDGQSELIRPLNRTFPLTRYWAIDLDAGCSRLPEVDCDPFGIFV